MDGIRSRDEDVADGAQREIQETLTVTRPVFAVRVRAEPNVDGIRTLKAWLKIGLRVFGLKCLGAYERKGENTMAINLNDTRPQNSKVIPDGVYHLCARLVPGGAGSDGMLTRAKNGRSLMLRLECDVLDEEYKDHLIYDWVTVELDEKGSDDAPAIDKTALDKLRTSLRLGRDKARAILDSSFGLDPNDRSPEAEKRRTIESWDIFDGRRFWGQVSERPGRGQYGPSNQIDFIVVPGDPSYPTPSREVATRGGGGGHHRQQPFDDDIPFITRDCVF
jgi:hypothetical protein